jgi:hypothetical protein
MFVYSYEYVFIYSIVYVFNCTYEYIFICNFYEQRNALHVVIFTPY